MDIQAVFLDAGGTLLREVPHRARIYADVARAHGAEVDEEGMRVLMYRAHGELPLRIGGHFRYSRGWFDAFIERILGGDLGLARARVAAAREVLLARFADPASFRAQPGALRLLESLRALGLRTGVVSNWSEALPGILDGLGLGRHLDVVLVSAAEELEKPDPELFARAARRAGAPPRACVHAGDDLERDVQGARAAGMLPVLVEPRVESLVPPVGGRPPPEQPVRVADLVELERWIRARAS